MRGRILRHALIFALITGSASSCLPNLGRVLLPGPTPTSTAATITERVDDAVIAGSLNVLDLLTDAGKLATQIREVERALHASGVLSNEKDAQFDVGFLELQHAADFAIESIRAGAVKTWPQLRSVVQPILDRLPGITGPLSSQTVAAVMAGALETVVRTALKAATPRLPGAPMPLPGGAQ